MHIQAHETYRRSKHFQIWQLCASKSRHQFTTTEALTQASVHFHIWMSQKNTSVRQGCDSKSLCVKFHYHRHGGSTIVPLYYFFVTAGTNNTRRNYMIQYPFPSLHHFLHLLILHTYWNLFGFNEMLLYTIDCMECWGSINCKP